MTRRPPSFFARPPSFLNPVPAKKIFENHQINLADCKTISIFAVPNHNGTMAEWLGSGLQNRVQQFDSAWYLKEGDSIGLPSFFLHYSRAPVFGWFFLKHLLQHLCESLEVLGICVVECCKVFAVYIKNCHHFAIFEDWNHYF